jgi:4a-hydroxytetrahydrobiopterin dehydratase
MLAGTCEPGNARDGLMPLYTRHMTPMTDEHCVACRPNSPHVSGAETEELLPLIPDWSIVEGSTPVLERTFNFSDFARAMAFTSAVGKEAEAEGHHPEITVTWGKATVRWWTHTIGGLHRNDFIMAAKTDIINERQGA